VGFDLKDYPKNWKAIVKEIGERSGGRCECLGECGLHPPKSGKVRRCIEINGTKAKWARGKIMLTTAHLNHKPMDARRSNLRHMCQRCHLRYDVDHHQKTRIDRMAKEKGLTSFI